jgi:hypothetical protein
MGLYNRSKRSFTLPFKESNKAEHYPQKIVVQCVYMDRPLYKQPFAIRDRPTTGI